MSDSNNNKQTETRRRTRITCRVGIQENVCESIWVTKTLHNIHGICNNDKTIRILTHIHTHTKTNTTHVHSSNYTQKGNIYIYKCLGL